MEWHLNTVSGYRPYMSCLICGSDFISSGRYSGLLNMLLTLIRNLYPEQFLPEKISRVWIIYVFSGKGSYWSMVMFLILIMSSYFWMGIGWLWPEWLGGFTGISRRMKGITRRCRGAECAEDILLYSERITLSGIATLALATQLFKVEKNRLKCTNVLHSVSHY